MQSCWQHRSAAKLTPNPPSTLTVPRIRLQTTPTAHRTKPSKHKMKLLRARSLAHLQLLRRPPQIVLLQQQGSSGLANQTMHELRPWPLV